MVDKKDKIRPRPGDEDVPGYVRFDDRGNAVWRWAPKDPARPDDIDETCNLLSALDNSELSLEDSMIIRREAGSDPYNTAKSRSPWKKASR